MNPLADIVRDTSRVAWGGHFRHELVLVTRRAYYRLTAWSGGARCQDPPFYAQWHWGFLAPCSEPQP